MGFQIHPTRANGILAPPAAPDAAGQADAAAAQIDLRILPASATLAVPPFPVLRILSNVLANAVRHAPGARILVGARRRQGYVSLEVHDSGPGLSETDLIRVRERLERGDNAGGEAGFGLGLSIVGKLARDHELEWTIDSSEGVGTRVSLLVPRVA